MFKTLEKEKKMKMETIANIVWYGAMIIIIGIIAIALWGGTI
jgi:hypothetical protein